MVDQPKIEGMLRNLGTYIDHLLRLSRVQKEPFLLDPDKIGSTKYNFVVAIECCIDIGTHIIASQRFRHSVDNADVFGILAEHNIVPGDLLPSLVKMARFRNLLVHLYWKVDDEIVYRTLTTSLGDLSRYAAAVAAYVRA